MLLISLQRGSARRALRTWGDDDDAIDALLSTVNVDAALVGNGTGAAVAGVQQKRGQPRQQQQQQAVDPDVNPWLTDAQLQYVRPLS